MGSHAASRIPALSSPQLGRRCPVCVSSAALEKGAAVWVFAGRHPAALLEEDDSYPAKFPLKIHPCRQLSDVCDGNTWKDFYLQQQNRPVLTRAGSGPGTVLCPSTRGLAGCRSRAELGLRPSKPSLYSRGRIRLPCLLTVLFLGLPGGDRWQILISLSVPGQVL